MQVREPIEPLARRRGLFYGWWLACLSALVVALVAVPLFYGMTAWFPERETSFGWSRAELAWAFSLTRVEGSITGPISGVFIDKLGPRRMIIIGMLPLGAGFLLLGQIQELWHLYAAFIIMSVGAGLGTWLPMMTVLNSWFIRQRSTAMALAMEGAAVGGVVLVPILAWAIQADHLGWRATATGIGVVIMLLALPIALLVRNRPEEYGHHPDGRPPRPVVATLPDAQDAGEEEPDFTWREALRTRAFWLITMGHSLSAIVIVTVTVHLGSMLNLDRGFSLQMVGWVVSVFMAVAAASTLVGGYVGDRVPIRLALFVPSSIQSLAVVVALMANSAPMAFLFAVLLGIGFGARTPLTSAIRGVYFGRRAFASITGISMVPMNFFLFGAPIFAGYMFEYTGSYEVPFVAVAWVSFLGACLFLLLGDPKPLASSKRTA